MSVRHDATVKYYYLDTSGQQTGPVLLGALKELFAGKKIHTARRNQPMLRSDLKQLMPSAGTAPEQTG